MITFFKNSRQNGYNLFREEVQVLRLAFKKDLGEDYIRQFCIVLPTEKQARVGRVWRRFPTPCSKEKKKQHIKQIKQKHKQLVSPTPLRNNKEKSVFCFSRYSRERFFFLMCFQVLRDFIIYQERHILPNERLLTFMNVTVQLQPIHMQSSVDKGFGKCD